jgi:hypothetical protein
MNTIQRLALIALLTAGLAWQAAADETDWPQQIDTPRAQVLIYQPQPDSLVENILEGRAAVSVTLTGETEPVFGAIFFKARLETDREERLATIENVKIVQARFPGRDDEGVAELTKLLESEIPKWNLPISLDALIATLDLADERRTAAANINNDAPIILFTPEPTVLVTLDGEPRLQKEDDTSLMRAINTPFTVLLDTTSKIYYLNADAKTWYQATEITGDWQISTNVPKDVAARAPEPEEVDPEEVDPEEVDPDESTEEPGPPPKVIVATQPTELISSTGDPEYSPIDGTELLYMSNTDSDVLMNLNGLGVYVLLSGRWYTSDSMEGPWTWVAGEDLPADFAKIPEDNNMGTVLYAVPGTNLANEAVLDAQIPQTAVVNRKTATLEVEYDGEPKFEPIEGTNLTYVINSPTPVIKYESAYFAVDEGVWFVAGDPQGKWQAATEVPDEIYTIPPESPMYFVTFVKIYNHTDDEVNVGYTSGYTGTYIYNTTVVYGTGWYYPGWYGSYYYPRPATWGFHVRYNPWGGWSFGLSYSNGPFTFTIGRGGWYRGGWWGPGRYRGYRRGYRHGYRRGYRSGARAGYRAGQRNGNRNANRNNLYRSQNNKARGTQVRTDKMDSRNRSQAAGGRQNNVYADRDGGVHRKTDQGWQQRTGNSWENSPDGGRDRAGTQPDSTPSQADRSRDTQNANRDASRNQQQSRDQLNKSHDSRQRGNQRTSSYNQQRSGGGRSGGGRSGGGGGRRR